MLLDGPGQEDDDGYADADDGDDDDKYIYMTHCELMRSKQSQSLAKNESGLMVLNKTIKDGDIAP